MGPRARRMVVHLALDPDRGAEDGGEQEADGERHLEGDVDGWHAADLPARTETRSV